jgi:succinoglycan biosynthesis transport protein ExoP
MDFWRVVSILNRRKWLILFSATLTALLVFAAGRAMGSKWVATVRFVTPAADQLSSTGRELPSPSPTTELLNAKNQAAMYLGIVKSSDVLEAPLKKLRRISLARTIGEQISFQAAGTRIYELSITDDTPVGAVDLTNEIAKSFVSNVQKLYTAQAKRGVALQEDQVRQLDKRITAAKARYDTVRRRYGIVTNLNDELQPAYGQLQQQQQQLNLARAQIADARARRHTLAEQLQTVAQTPEDLQLPTDAVVEQLRQQLGSAEANLVIYQTRYTDQKMEVVQAKATRDALLQRLRQEEARVAASAVARPNPVAESLLRQIQTAESEIGGYKARIAALQASIQGVRQGVVRYTGADSTLATLAGEVAQLNETRGNLLLRLQGSRTALDAAERQNPIVIMDQAGAYNPPIDTTAGRTLKLVGLGALAALVAMCGLVIGLDGVDRRVKTIAEAEMALPVPVISGIPHPHGAVTAGDLALAAQLHPQSLHAESYRFLALHLLNRSDGRSKALMALSAKAGQGSTATVANLGISLAQAGKRVILVDANWRGPHLHEVFDTPNEVGFSTLLASPSTPAVEAALQPTGVPNLLLLPSGPMPRNLWEALRSPNLHRVGDCLRANADFVLYDTPSALAFTDAMDLASIVDGAILCVRALESLSGAEQRVARMLEESYVPILGAVLHDVPASALESYRNYEHYYALPSRG